MLIELHKKRMSLAETAVEMDAGSTIYHRLKAGEGDFQFQHVTVGFILNQSPKHEGAFGQDTFVPMPMDAGEGWVLPADLDGKARWDQDLDFINVHFSASALARVNNGVAPEFPVLSQVKDPTFVHMALNLHETADATETVMRMYRDTMMFALAAHVNRIYGGAMMQPLAAKLDPRLQRAVNLIESDFSKDISLEDLASAAAMSPFHFSRSFKRATGLPPHQYLASRRVEAAKALLKTTTLPIIEIGFRVGYQDVSHFTQLFKRFTGVTPGEFRK
jgi:AraC family transcriptional regulator